MERYGENFHKEWLSTDTFDFKVDVGFLPWKETNLNAEDIFSFKTFVPC